MPINEIEIEGTSISFRVLAFAPELTPKELLSKAMSGEDVFSTDPENPGFHDCDADDQAGIFRGYFSTITPFEVEHLVDGIMTKSLLKTIETCEFFSIKSNLFLSGKGGPGKILQSVLSGMTGCGVIPVEFDFTQMNHFQERFTMLNSIGLTNPKDKPIRRAKLAGKMEDYSEVNFIDPHNHGIKSVSGTMDTPLGPMTITVGDKGAIALKTRKGFILTPDCLLWILNLLQEKP